MSSTQRITELDSLKGLLIILMLFGHSSVMHNQFPIVFNWIYSFHMPAFFILAGMFFKPTEKSGIRYYYQKTARNYLRPYFITAFFCIVIGSLYKYYFLEKDIIDSCKDLIFRSLYVTSYRWTLGVSWFLWSLFWALTTYNVITVIFHNYMTRTFAILSVFILSVASLILYIPLSIQSGLCAMTYVYVGHIANQHKNEIKSIASHKLFIFIILILWIYTSLRMEIHVSDTIYPHGLTSVFCSSVFSLFIISHAKLIDCKFLNFIGKHTLLVLCVHQTLNMVDDFHFLFSPLEIEASPFVLMIVECLTNTTLVLAITLLILGMKSKLSVKTKAF